MSKRKSLTLPAGHSAMGTEDAWPLPAAASRTLARVAPSSIPMLCLGCGGSAFGRIVLGVHRASERIRLERIDLHISGAGGIMGLPRGTAASFLTLALDGIEALDSAGQELLAEYLEGSAPRLVCATRADLDSLAESWRPELLALLSTVTIHAPGLAERADEIGDLAQDRIGHFCEELEIEPIPALTDGARRALEDHPWPGDVTELDAVLLSSLLEREGVPRLDAADLVWTSRSRRQPGSASREDPRGHPRATESDLGDAKGPAPGGVPAREPRPNENPAPKPLDAAIPGNGGFEALESVAVELAHQLKNPLVTVKTFVSNAGRMDSEEMARFGELVLDAVERIDAPLDQILAYARLPGHRDEPVEVAGILNRSLSSLAQEFAKKNIELEGLPPTLMPAHGSARSLEFALSVLSRHLLEASEVDTTVTISRSTPELLVVSHTESAAASHLREITADPDSSFPLALLLVRGALVGMGGGLRVTRTQTRVKIELSFAAA